MSQFRAMSVSFEQSLFFSAAMTSIVFWAITGPIDLFTQLALLVVSVVVFGLPHGALDPLVARQEKIVGVKNSGVLLFFLAYLAALTPILFLWWYAPEIGLMAFLLYGAWHFAQDWTDALSKEARTLCGLGLISLPALFHPAETATIFSTLTGSPMGWLVEALELPGMVAAAGILLISFTLRHQNLPMAIELCVTLVIAAFLPPLLFFLVYFCFLHSTRNIRILVSELKFSQAQILKAAATYSLLAATIGLAVFFGLTGQMESQTAIIRIVFIGLAALTAPHLILHIISFARSKKNNSANIAEQTVQQQTDSAIHHRL